MVAIPSRLIVPFLALVKLEASSYKCANANDCEMLGECIAGNCECYPGFTGPSCSQIDVVPIAGDEFAEAAWPPAGGLALGADRRAYGWGFSVAPDAKKKTLLHAVANVGCYPPKGSHTGMVTGTVNI